MLEDSFLKFFYSASSVYRHAIFQTIMWILVPPIPLVCLVLTVPGVLGRIRERHVVTFLPMVDTWLLLPDFPDLASKLCRLGVDETSGMQKGRYWNT